MGEVYIENYENEEVKDSGTAGSTVINFPTPSETTSPMARMSPLTEDIGFNRSTVKVIQQDFDNLHERSRFSDWHSATSDVGKSEAAVILGLLADLGFAWRDIARLVGVSVPAIQKWRKGERCTGENRRGLAGLLAMCQMIQSHDEIQDVASWFEMPIYSGIPLTPLDLFEQKQMNLIFEYSSGSTSAEQILDQFDANWRHKYESDFEVFKDLDGELSIKMAER